MNIFYTIGRLSYRYRWYVVSIWGIVFLGSLILAPRLPGMLKGGGFDGSNSESERVQNIMVHDFGVSPAPLTIVFVSDHLQAQSPAFQAAESQALAEVRKMPQVSYVMTYSDTKDPAFISKNSKESYALIGFNVSMDQTQDLVEEVRGKVRSNELNTFVTGAPAVYLDIQRASSEDVRRAEEYAFPFAFIILVIAFGTLVAAGVPVLMGGVSVVVALAILYLITGVYDMSIFVMNMATMLGLGLGIDYALFAISRFREELASFPVSEAVPRMVSTAGRSIFFSGTAVLIGLTGLFFFPFMFMRSIGVGGTLVVFISVLSALTLLPATLGILGHRINSWAVRRTIGDSGFWSRGAEHVMRHPVLVLLIVGVILTTLLYPAAHMKLGIPEASILPNKYESRIGDDILKTDFDYYNRIPIEVVATLPGDPLSASNLARIQRLDQELSSIKGINSVESIYSVGEKAARARGVSPQGTVTPEELANFLALPEVKQSPEMQKVLRTFVAGDKTLIKAVPIANPYSESARAEVDQVRNIQPPEGVSILVGGLSAGQKDFITSLYSYMPYAVAFVLGVTYLVLFLTFRSFFIPLKAVIVNILSLTASFGAMVFVFQDGNLSNILDFTPLGFVDATLPILMFCTVFGVSMDYEVFLLSRIKEAYDSGDSNEGSVAKGLTVTAGIITSAASIIIVVTGAFAFTGIILTKAIGLGLAVAVLVDATIIRVLLVPAAMLLLGDWNWWPGGRKGVFKADSS